MKACQRSQVSPRHVARFVPECMHMCETKPDLPMRFEGHPVSRYVFFSHLMICHSKSAIDPVNMFSSDGNV
jgi:hypothetical protein